MAPIKCVTPRRFRPRIIRDPPRSGGKKGGKSGGKKGGKSGGKKGGKSGGKKGGKKGPKITIIIHRRNRYLPCRPKRPLNNYTAFIRDYFKNNKCKDVKEGMKKAAKAWGKLSGTQRRAYGRRCDKSKLLYAGAMEQWRRQRNALKLPASSYALFLQATWEKEKKKRQQRDFEQVSKHAAKSWADLADAKKRVYQQAHEMRADNYFTLMDQLKSGEIKMEALGGGVVAQNAKRRRPKKRKALDLDATAADECEAEDTSDSDSDADE